VETGNTLKAHNLMEVEVIAHSTARLIVNRASLKLKHRPLTELIERMRSSVGAPHNGHQRMKPSRRG
jgi:ATP phosphoribosyltransferase